MKLCTIGFAQKSAERFFALLQQHRVQVVIDVRLRPRGQLSGFARQDDLRYFLRRLIGCDYQHLPVLAPDDDLLTGYRKDHDWAGYVARFEALMDARDVPRSLDRALFETNVTCLLCSEAQPERCHRRLVAERIARTWPGVDIVHVT